MSSNVRRTLVSPAVIVMASMCWLPQSEAHEEQPRLTLIKNVNIFDGKSEKLAVGRDVLIEGNLIKTIGKGLNAGAGATVIEDGRTLIPGFFTGGFERQPRSARHGKIVRRH
jgi:hypothetical protein